jgi:hypothetical protein
MQTLLAFHLFMWTLIFTSQPWIPWSTCERLIDKSIVVFDNYLCGVDDVIKATHKFSEAHPDCVTFSLLSGQGLMVNRS